MFTTGGSSALIGRWRFNFYHVLLMFDCFCCVNGTETFLSLFCPLLESCVSEASAVFAGVAQELSCAGSVWNMNSGVWWSVSTCIASKRSAAKKTRCSTVCVSVRSEYENEISSTRALIQANSMSRGRLLPYLLTKKFEKLMTAVSSTPVLRMSYSLSHTMFKLILPWLLSCKERSASGICITHAH